MRRSPLQAAALNLPPQEYQPVKRGSDVILLRTVEVGDKPNL
jgi:hypothetical protein